MNSMKNDTLNQNGTEEVDEMDLIFVLDKSGSMWDLTEDTIGGFNSLIEKERKMNPNAYVTLVLFDTKYKVIYTRKHISEVEKLTQEVYEAYGCTALLDAVGTTISRLNGKVSEKVLFVISTDGLENSSIEYTKEDIKKMITSHDWEFIFLGANIDSFNEASSIGIDSSRTANFEASPDGVFAEWRSVSIASRSISNNRSLDDCQWKRDLK